MSNHVMLFMEKYMTCWQRLQAGGKDSVPGSPARESVAGLPSSADGPRAVLHFLVAVARGAACGWGTGSRPASAAAAAQVLYLRFQASRWVLLGARQAVRP